MRGTRPFGASLLVVSTVFAAVAALAGQGCFGPTEASGGACLEFGGTCVAASTNCAGVLPYQCSGTNICCQAAIGDAAVLDGTVQNSASTSINYTFPSMPGQPIGGSTSTSVTVPTNPGTPSVTPASSTSSTSVESTIFDGGMDAPTSTGSSVASTGGSSPSGSSSTTSEPSSSSSSEPSSSSSGEPSSSSSSEPSSSSSSEPSSSSSGETSTSSSESSSSSSSSEASSSSSEAAPTTCADLGVDEPAGCCIGNTSYQCLAGVLFSHDCTTDVPSRVCSWDETFHNYGCIMGTSISDPSGTYPKTCPE